MKCKVTYTGQSKAVVTNVVIETDSRDDIDQEQTNNTIEEAKRAFVEADTFAHAKTMTKQ